MKKTLLKACALLLGMGIFAVQVMAQEAVTSLRGVQDVEAEATVPMQKNWQRDRDPIPRDYVQQPPLIPHAIDGYMINRKSNKCLTCHSWANYKQAGATKISQTHFEDRDKHVLANISARRYFCTQCHVPQVDAQPLVENTFEPIQAITGK